MIHDVLNQEVKQEDQQTGKEILFIINPISGTQSKAKLVEMIHRYFEPIGAQLHIAYTQYAGHATELARDAVTKQFGSVVAVGGDGTMNEVARALVHSSTALGILPMGSGNGLARHLGIPMQPEAAVRLLTRGKRIQIDSCTLNDTPFFCTAGVGFDAHVGYLFSQQKRRGFSTYVQTTLGAFFSYQPGQYHLQTDGLSKDGPAFTITFANAAQYGNNAYIAPQADIQDGLLDVSIIRPFPKPAFMEIGLRLFRKTLHTSRYVEIIRTPEITLAGESPLRVHLDGESHLLNGPLEVKTIPASLWVLV